MQNKRSGITHRVNPFQFTMTRNAQFLSEWYNLIPLSGAWMSIPDHHLKQERCLLFIGHLAMNIACKPKDAGTVLSIHFDHFNCRTVLHA